MTSTTPSFEELLKSSQFNDLLGEDVLSTLRCPVCMDFFKEPIILACGHTFCYGCLYDMSMHTKSRMMNVHIRNVRIHCPNCRVPVYVQGIIQKRCTTNFTVASFLESLESVKVPVKSFSDSSTNTESKETGIDDDASYDYDETSLNKMDSEIQSAFSALGGNTDVIRDAWREIHNLRESINHSAEVSVQRDEAERCKTGRDERKDRGRDKILRQNISLQSQDPAILMSSLAGHRKF